MGLGQGYQKQDCSVARALEVIGERWTLLVIRDCFYGVRRFGDLQAHLDIPKAVLAERLKSLVSLGVLDRRDRATGVEYVLTARGRELWPVVFAVWQWGEHHLAPQGARRLFSHAACGTDLTGEGRCPACEVRPDVGDLVIRNGPGADPTLRHDRVSTTLRGRPHRLLMPLFPEPGSRLVDEKETS